MRLAFTLLSLSMMSSLSLAQIDTTLRDYFPTHIGNLWEYEEFDPPNSFRYQIRLTGDTLMSNGRRYYRFIGTNGGFYRADDSLRIYKYVIGSQSCSDMEYVIYDLGIRDKGIWRTCLPIEGGADSLSRFIGLYQTFLNFPLPGLQVARDVKQYCDARVHMPSGDTTFCNLVPGIAYIPRRLARGLGLVWSQFEGPPHDLVGAIINGVTYGTITSVPTRLQQGGWPGDASLEQNYPNPFNPVTRIRYNIPEDGFISLQVIDMGGKHIKTLVERRETRGTHEVQWDATDEPGNVVATGTYFCRLSINRGLIGVRKFLFVK